MAAVRTMQGLHIIGISLQNIPKYGLAQSSLKIHEIFIVCHRNHCRSASNILFAGHLVYPMLIQECLLIHVMASRKVNVEISQCDEMCMKWIWNMYKCVKILVVCVECVSWISWFQDVPRAPPVSLSRDRPAVGLASNEDLAKSTLELPWDVGTGALAQKRKRVVAACGLNLKCPFPKVMCLVERSTNYAELCPCPLPSIGDPLTLPKSHIPKIPSGECAQSRFLWLLQKAWKVDPADGQATCQCQKKTLHHIPSGQLKIVIYPWKIVI